MEKFRVGALCRENKDLSYGGVGWGHLAVEEIRTAPLGHVHFSFGLEQQGYHLQEGVHRMQKERKRDLGHDMER